MPRISSNLRTKKRNRLLKEKSKNHWKPLKDSRSKRWTLSNKSSENNSMLSNRTRPPRLRIKCLPETLEENSKLHKLDANLGPLSSALLLTLQRNSYLSKTLLNKKTKHKLDKSRSCKMLIYSSLSNILISDSKIISRSKRSCKLKWKLLLKIRNWLKMIQRSSCKRNS